MTPEEFDKLPSCIRYKELLDSAKNQGHIIVRVEDIENAFPELKENEDESIRNGLIALLKFGLEDGSAIAPGFNVSKEQALAWLKKQGKKQSIWSDGDRTMVFTLMRDVDQMTYISNEGKNERFQWLNSLEDKFNKGE